MVSLICTTYNREAEFKLFILSLSNLNKFEIIVIDQNEFISYVDDWKPYFESNNIKYTIIKTPRVSLSKARNIGLKFVNYSIIAFPDDDCIYFDDLIKYVVNYFENNSYIGLLVFNSISDLDLLNFQRKDSFFQELTKFQLLGNLISYTAFFNTKTFLLPAFDERLGVGCYFSSAEETDFAYQFLLLNKLKSFIMAKDLFIYHPSKELVFNQSREIGYALGLGAFVRKHFKLNTMYLFYYFLLPLIIKPLGLLVLSVCRLSLIDFQRATLRLSYRIMGFLKFSNSVK